MYLHINLLHILYATQGNSSSLRAALASQKVGRSWSKC